MEAIRLHARGGPEQLVYEDAPEPACGPRDALVRVYAAGITRGELAWNATYQGPDGSSRTPSIPGHEFSGVIEAVGAAVTEVRPGDAVYGLADFWRDGAAAAYLAAEAGSLAPKPRTPDHSQAAAVPLSALTAWQALFEHGGLAAGQRALIHGAAGGVGSYAVQLAHWRGARVIATAAPRDFAFLRDLGADETIDYAAQRFEDTVRGVDLVLDTIGGEMRRRSWSVLRQGGVLVTLPGPVAQEEAARHGVRGVFFIVKPDREQLIEAGRLIDEGRLRPVVDAVLPLERAREAFVRVGSGHHRGKIVLQVAGRSAAAG
jgi:NADPH:quinone reductase-like Zn-dependent oxidoreductase